jgi:cytoskeletal protein CcmA (bactofilin family)
MAEERKPPPQYPSELSRRVVSMPGGGQNDSLHGESNKKLVVGRDISLSGEITDCDILVVEGKVKASLVDSRRFEISESGSFEGTVEIETAEIKGQFDGELLVRGRLLVRRTGRVRGRIRYAELEVERGGQIAGDIQMITESTTSGRVLSADFGEDLAADTATPAPRPLEKESDISA